MSGHLQMPDTNKTVAMIGLGLMGTAMTQRLLEHGFKVVVWNRSPDKAEPLLAMGASWSDRPLTECSRAIISLYSSNVVRDVLQQMATDLKPGQILIDTTTGEPSDAESMCQLLANRGIEYLDAPISGSSDQTRRGDAIVMVGGARKTFDACADLWSILGKSVFYTGDSGSAAKMKLVSNLVLGLNRAALAEGLTYAAAMGVAPEAALEILKSSAAYSRAMDIKGQKMLTGDFSVQARLSQHLKDVRIIIESAARTGLTLPLSQVHRELLEHCEQLGLGDLDNSAIIRAFDQQK
jgi:3-hydroxyisobutyrate dehydrogenase-like beta-hydroxyacid dehydrogenase